MNRRLAAPLWVALTCAGSACRAPPDQASVVVDSLVVPGEALYLRGAYDSAAFSWNQALALPGTAGTPTEARLLHWLGLASYRQGDYSEARRLGEQALALKREHRMGRAEVAESQNGLGLLAWNEGRLQDAAALLQDAMAGFTEADDQAGVAKSSNNLALVAIELGRFAEAREGFGTARLAARATGNPRTEGRATTNLAMVEIWTGDPANAPVLLAEARRLADSAVDPVGLENALGQLAVAWSILGEPGRALATLDSALAIARRHGLREEEANNLLVAASIHREAGDADRALQLYDQARVINQELGLPVEAGMVLRSEAGLLLSRGVPQRARANLEQALVLHRESGARLEEFRDLLAVADLESRGLDPVAARRSLAVARAVATELDAPQVRAALAVSEAWVADRRADPGGALASLRAIAPELSLAGSAATIEAEWLRARAFTALGRLDSAIASGRRAVAAIQRTAGSFGSPQLRSSVAAERSEVFADLVIALLRMGQPQEAFQVADAARGRALIDHLAGARDAVRRGPMGQDLADRDRLLRSIDALLARLEEVQTTPRPERGPEVETTGRELAARLRQARAEYEAVLIRLAEREPIPSGVIGTREISPEAIQGTLRPDELLVQYFITTQRVIVFAMTRDTLQTHEAPVSRMELENRVRLARGLLSAPRDAAAAYPVLEELYRILIAPLQPGGMLQGRRRIVIVPHGVLSYLPFAALRDPRSGRYLVQEHSLEYVPTAAGFAALRAGSLVPAARSRMAIFAPFPEELPATAMEARAVRQTLPGSRTLSGTSATESALRRALLRGQTVHVAAHGIMNPVNPMFSSLRLARGSRGSPEDDGRFEVHEVLGVRIASPLVFLSGCETALGGARATPFARGEDFVTLAQAFLYAGAKGVVATLWRIDDEGAAAFTGQFYRHYPNQGAPEALAAAQRFLIGDGRRTHPYYWAGYTIAGDGPEMTTANPTRASVSR